MNQKTNGPSNDRAAEIAAGLVIKRVRRAVGRAKAVVQRAMNGDALEVGGRLGVVGIGLCRFRRVGTEHGDDVRRNAFEFDVGGRETADIAAGSRKRHPRSRGDLAQLVRHLRVAIRRHPGPVQERALEAADRAVRLEPAVAVGNRKAEPVAVEAGQR